MIQKIKKIIKIKIYIAKKYTPYEIGFISKNKKIVNIYNKMKW